MFGVILKNAKTSEEMRNRLGLVSVSDMVHQGRLGWFERVELKDADDRVSACRSSNIAVSVQRDRGRSRKAWKECVADEMRLLRLRQKDEQDLEE
jgi:hypothetical protein